jgi:threonine dehydrogenase-like Zn-dependent dehydrogenase
LLAGHITAPNKIELVEIEPPRLEPAPPEGEGQIIFEPHLACLCGSDLPYFDGELGGYPLPVGYSLHEMVGRVVATNGRRYRPGDRVLAVPPRQHGCFERFVVSEARAIPLDPRRPPEEALLAQPLGTVIFALKKLPTVLDKDVAVVGQGPIGQLFCAALANLGARQIIGIDKLQARLAMSTNMGATAVICTQVEDSIQAVRRLTGGRMADIVVECVGHRDQALNACVDLCAQFGRILAFGVPPVEVNGLRMLDLFTKNITLHTSVDPDFTRDFPLAMQWISERRVDLAPLVTHRYEFREIQTAFETFHDRKDGAQKVLLRFPAAG